MYDEQSKVCNDCDISKPTSEFYAGRKTCKNCYGRRCSAYRLANPDCASNDSTRFTQWALENKSKIQTMAKAWDEKNRVRRNERLKARRQENPEKFREWDRNRPRTLARKRMEQANKKRLRQATPKAFRTKELRKAIRQIYLARPDGFHVDHIVPINGKNVSGLHVPWNLQYLPASENHRKLNKIVPLAQEVAYQM